MKFVAVTLFLVVALSTSAQSVQLTEEEMDATIKPCIVFGRNCPSDGSMGNYQEMKKELSMMKVGIVMMGGRMPEECGCSGGERCDRECYYALMKVAVLELKAGQNNGQPQGGRRRRRRR